MDGTPKSDGFPLPDEMKHRILEIGIEHDTALNWDYPPDPSPWRQDQCDAFNMKIDNLIIDLTQILGGDYEILDQQSRYSEDPDLDRYLENPKDFRRS